MIPVHFQASCLMVVTGLNRDPSQILRTFIRIPTFFLRHYYSLNIAFCAFSKCYKIIFLFQAQSKNLVFLQFFSFSFIFPRCFSSKTTCKVVFSQLSIFFLAWAVYQIQVKFPRIICYVYFLHIFTLLKVNHWHNYQYIVPTLSYLLLYFSLG